MTLREAEVELFDCEHKTPASATHGIPYIAIPEMKEGRLDVSNARLVAEQDVAVWNRRVTPKEGDVILSRRTNPGVTAVVPADFSCVLGQNLVILRSRGTKVDQRFLRWLTRSPEWWRQIAKNLNVGAVFDSLRCADIPRFELLFPSLSEQRAIAHILGTLDDKIELNRQMNETLEAMARALFKSWFVDFDPVRAKAEGSDLGLPKAVADLFPWSFEESQLGQIPAGWSAVPLYDIATYVNGAAYAAFDPNDERRGLPIIKIAELKAGVTQQTRFSDVQMPDKYRITRGDILFSWSGNPDTSIDTFVWSHDAAWLNQHIFRVLPSRPHERAFVLTLLKHLRPVFAEIARNKQTTGLGHVTAADMKRLLVVLPDDKAIRAWNAIAATMLERAFLNEVEIGSVTTLRDTLLPKLMSGELRVKELRHFRQAIA